MPAIVVADLVKTFRVRPAVPGRGLGRLRALLHRAPAIDAPAVRGISFAIESGERVAFIGPNGAGKSTTLKMLTGILHPTSGQVEVAGFVPWRHRRQLAHRIGIVFGQRSQLWYHLPVRSSFELLGHIYGLERARQRERLARLARIFAIDDLLDRPVAQLSLGQRLRCEITAALLHGPAVLLLDEPTIGLDVTAKAALRDHLNALSREDGTTVLLTSHDTGDIERICDRVIVIDRGRLLLDRPLERLRRDFLRRRAVVIVTEQERPALDMAGVAVVAQEPYRLTLAIDTTVTSIDQIVTGALARLTVRDLVIENPPLEEVIRAIYRGELGVNGEAEPV
ncbi:ATP-binding cassette domain-containing protein [Rhodospirillaceae bacterium SYSU D60014]|uniref:ABC transporter ATP-binding protein n=1 Tax=Virgifigura deserti TaxID=2268457 RepID=UPI000E668BFA